MKPKPMPLAELLANEPSASPKAIAIRGVSADSRQCGEGYLFAALKGARADSADHIDEARRKGAVALLLSEKAECPESAKNLALIRSPNVAKNFAEIAARFHRDQPRMVAAITGTNGKSSTAIFAQALFASFGFSSASLGTLGVRVGSHAFPDKLTTPDPARLHRQLAMLARRGVSHAVLEASSHGLAQYRLDGVRLRAAALTHIGRDHLDYHKSEAHYLRAKLRLVEILPKNRPLVFYDRAKGAKAFARYAEETGRGLFRVSDKEGDLTLARSLPLADGCRLRLIYGGRHFETSLSLIGAFQRSNALLAAALALASDEDCAKHPDRLFAALQNLPTVPGRLEYIGHSAKGGHVYVDYAHTPDALSALLRDMRPHLSGRLHLLFGCGGERDVAKRGEMGALARALADRITITDDNPRGEDPAAIRQAILRACPDAEEIADRREAIARATDALEQGDALLVAGKGHEESQESSGGRRRFSDREEARLYLTQSGGAALGGIA